MPSAARGLTLVELLMAAAIAALLTAVAVPTYDSYVQRTRVGKAVTDLGMLDMRIEQFAANSFRLPDSLEQLPGTALEDPWGRPYRYLRIEGAGNGVKGKVRKDRKLNPINSDYDLYSVGKDGETVGPLVASKSRDDVVRAGNGGFIGLAADF